MPPEILSLVTDYISLLDYLRLFSTARSIVQKKLEYTGKHFCWNQDQFVVCCEQGQSTYVKGILKATNVDPNLDCFFIERGTIDAVQWTSCLGTLEMLDLLLSHPRVQLSTNLCIRLASDYGRTEHVKRLLKDPRIDPTHALTDACRVGHYDVCKLLLEDPRVDPAEDDHWPLIHAALYQHTDCARLLLEHPSVDPSIRNNQAIRLASAKGHTNMSGSQ
ncbi:hypothetical protein EDD86DRAFT_250051 [Gorgonomyces haynaldii]|nr:hypothetical protein EDD86DRAFT_250051 [Gorgonomyces haynaldii]